MGFVKWHTQKIDRVKSWLGLTDYQLLWIAWLKGLLMGGIITFYLML